MKKQPKPPSQTGSDTANAPQLATLQAGNLLDALLIGEHAPKRQAELIHGIVIANLLELLPDGKVRIALPSHGITNLCATPVCALHALTEGAPVAVMFEQGDTTRALVIGPMAGEATPTREQAHTPAPVHAHEAMIDNERIVIEAEQEIELRCGEAAIILTRDGRILLRGTYITSHASATQRIRGGGVQIN